MKKPQGSGYQIYKTEFNLVEQIKSEKPLFSSSSVITVPARTWLFRRVFPTAFISLSIIQLPQSSFENHPLVNRSWIKQSLKVFFCLFCYKQGAFPEVIPKSRDNGPTSLCGCFRASMRKHCA